MAQFFTDESGNKSGSNSFLISVVHVCVCVCVCINWDFFFFLLSLIYNLCHSPGVSNSFKKDSRHPEFLSS